MSLVPRGNCLPHVGAIYRVSRVAGRSSLAVLLAVVEISTVPGRQRIKLLNHFVAWGICDDGSINCACQINLMPNCDLERTPTGQPHQCSRVNKKKQVDKGGEERGGEGRVVTLAVINPEVNGSFRARRNVVRAVITGVYDLLSLPKIVFGIEDKHRRLDVPE